MRSPFARLYEWDGDSRPWSDLRTRLVSPLIMLSPIVLSLVLGILLPTIGLELPRMLSDFLVSLSLVLLVFWIIYTSMRTARSVWLALQGKPHDLQEWRKP